MKILMLSDLYPPTLGGMEKHVQALSRELAKRGHQVIVCTTGLPDLPKYEEEKGVKIERLQGFFQRIPFMYRDPRKRFHPPTEDWSLVKQLRQIVQRQRPDIIHAHGWILYSALPLRRDFSIPLLATLHDYGFLCPKRSLLTTQNTLCNEPFTSHCIVCGNQQYGFMKSLAAYYGVRINKSRLKSMDKFIAVSEFVKEVHVKHLGLSDKDVVTIPVFFSPEPEREKEIELPEDFILFVGVLIPDKGVNVLIEAFRKLDTQTKLILIGGKHPDYRYNSTRNIVVIENAPHHMVMHAMSRCRFAVFPSKWPEPFGTVAIEAMSQGKAVIACNMGGLKDIVVDKEIGILVPPNNSAELAQSISYLLERPEVASEMGNKGHDRFRKNYTPDVVVPVLIDTYRSLLR